MSGLTEKQGRFVEEYLIDLNATQAAIRAGYSKDTAYSQGQRLLKNVEVQTALEAARQERRERSRLSADQIVFELEKLAVPDIRELYDSMGRLKRLKDMTLEQAQMIQEISMTEHGPKLKLYDRMKALDMLMKHHGLYDKGEEQADAAPEWARQIFGAGGIVQPAPVRPAQGTEGDSPEPEPV